MRNMSTLNKYLLLIFMIFLASCGGVFDPKGYIAYEQKKLIMLSFFVMLSVAVPVFIMALFFAYRYSEKRNNKYEPYWEHNTKLELVIWVIPIAIVIFLSVITWTTSHSLDPRKSIDIAVSKEKPIIIQAVSLEWKWLFIYPEYGVATVNSLYIPINTPVRFSITSDTAMNALWIPQLGGMIYAMAGMETNLSLIAHQEGVYSGLSGAYSGYGFSGMQFKANVVNNSEFNKWVSDIRGNNLLLNNNYFEELTKPTTFDKATFMKIDDIALFYNIIKKYQHNNVDTSKLKHAN